jgi:predicted phosphodiesterase
MRVAALYDIHGNLPALEAVLEEVRKQPIDRVVVGGDVLPGPMPRECLARLRDLEIPTQFIRGNGERSILELLAGGETAGLPDQLRETMRWSAQQLLPEEQAFLANWPATLQFEIGGLGEVLFCHATPGSDTTIFTPLTSDDRVARLFEGISASVAICGHTHAQFERMIGKLRVVNAGSVGMPFGEAGAYWLLLGQGIERRRASYDLAKAAARIRATKYPQAEQFAAHNVLQPPSEAEMLALFSKAESS